MTVDNKQAEYRHYSDVDTAFVGKSIRVVDMPNGKEDVIGCTSINDYIHVNYSHPIMDDLTDEQKIVFRCGVNAHELLHKLLSDFVALNKHIKTFPESEQPIFLQIQNVMEDPAIEFFGNQEIGGDLIESLRFSIAHVYRKSQPIQSYSSGFSQFIAACIHFGDMGALKGVFTDDLAKSIFKEAAPVIDACIEEPDAEKRLMYAKDVFELSRPLWQATANMNELLRQLADVMKSNGKNCQAEHGEAIIKPTRCNSSSSKKLNQVSARRKNLLARIEETNTTEDTDDFNDDLDELDGNYSSGDFSDEFEQEDDDDENSGNGSSSSDDNSDEEKNSGGDNNTEDSLSEDETDEDEDGKSGSGNKDDSSDEDNDENDNGNNQDNSSDKNDSDSGKENKKGYDDNDDDDDDDLNDWSDDSSNKKEDNSSSEDSKRGDSEQENGNQQDQNGRMPEIDMTSDVETNSVYEVEISKEEYEIPESVITSMLGKISEERTVMEKSIDEIINDNTPALEPVLASPLWQGKIKCNNKIITLPWNLISSEQIYSVFRNKLGGLIKILFGQLNRIFIQDIEEIMYRASGKVDMKRLASGQVTAKLFYKKKDPSNKHNMVIFILFDRSGSMSGKKIEAVKELLVLLSEVFGKLKIPIYIMGYSEESGGQVEHRHYIRWNNTAKERLKLMEITTGGCNFDGYSIRYATEILKQKDADHKLLIALSDGAPASSHYKTNTSNAVNDTRNAVREAKKIASVLGVAIGDSHLDAIKFIYERDFLHINDVGEMTTSLAKAIKKIVSKWE